MTLTLDLGVLSDSSKKSLSDTRASARLALSLGAAVAMEYLDLGVSPSGDRYPSLMVRDDTSDGLYAILALIAGLLPICCGPCPASGKPAKLTVCLLSEGLESPEPPLVTVT